MRCRDAAGLLVSVGFSLCVVACKGKAKGDAGSDTEREPSAPPAGLGSGTSWRDDMKKACAVPAAAAPHVQRVLAIQGKVTADPPSTSGTGHKVRCGYNTPAGLVAIDIEINAGPRSIQSVRKTLDEQLGKQPTQDVPGFGDDAYSKLTPVVPGTPPTTHLGVRRGDVMITMTSDAPLDKMRALLTELGHQLDVKL